MKSKELDEQQNALDRQKLEENIRQRLHAKLALEEQLRDIEMRRMQRKADEDKFRLDQLQLLAEQDRIELLTREKQWIKKQEHQKRVRQLLAERETARNAQIIELIQEHNELIALEKRR